MRVVNLTPHEITLQLEDGRRVSIPPSGKIFRLDELDEPASSVAVKVDGEDVEVEVEVVRRSFRVTNFEELFEKEDMVAIVSLPALIALRQAGIRTRAMIVAPDTGATAIRDERGQIVAVRRFITM